MIICKSKVELEKMHRAGLVVHELLEALRKMVASGVTTLDLEREAERRIAEAGALPAFKGYNGYPCVLCTSVNDEIIHGIPSETRVLREGDIISLDFGAVVEGYYGDAARTALVGAVLEGLIGPLAPEGIDEPMRAHEAVQALTLLALRGLGVVDARARGLVVQTALPEG